MIVFLILHYGSQQITEKCVKSILRIRDQISESIKIVIVDNNVEKSDTIRKNIELKYNGIDCIEILYYKGISSFSAANNFGYKYIKRKYKPDFLVVTNNDVIFFQKEFVDIVTQKYKESGFYIFSPDIININTQEHQSPLDFKVRSRGQVRKTILMNKLVLTFFDVFYPLMKIWIRYDRKSQLSRKQKVDNIRRKNIIPYGACIVLSAKFINMKEKIFEPETKFFYEEYILAYQCFKEDLLILYDPSAKVLHGNKLATKGKFQNDKEQTRFMIKNTLEASKVYKSLIDK